MSQTKVVSIGGIDYDSLNGLPIEKQAAAVQQELQRVQSIHAKGIHAAQQRSTALNRRFVKKTQLSGSSKSPSNSIDVRRVVKRSPHISKFAKDPQALAVKRSVADIGPTMHASVIKTHQVQVKESQVAPSAREIKHAAIGQALANAKPDTSSHKKPRNRVLNVASASLGMLLIAGYFTYVNMPNLSVRVAAAQAGINASYPDYRPVGYSLNGPVAYSDGQVSMKFHSNSGPLAFALKEARSGWDSSALLEKYVNPRSTGKYATYSDAGLTIYTYGTNAAWVNSGILYTVEGDALLSNEQIRRIATSM